MDTRAPAVRATEVEATLFKVRLLLPILLELDLAQLVNKANTADTLGPILDPTAWNKAAPAIANNRIIASILLDAQRELRRRLGAETCDALVANLNEG